MKLTDAKIRTAAPQQRPYKLFDGRGLYLLINPNGSRWWRLKYRYGGKEKLLALGTYPTTSLKRARRKCDEAREQLDAGIDPSAVRKAEQQSRLDRETGSFELVAREWHAKQSESWGEVHATNVMRRLELYVFPKIGASPIRGIKGSDLLVILKAVEARGTQETAYRIKQSLGAIFRYAIATNRAESDQTSVLKGALAPVPDRHYASITNPAEVGALLRAVREYKGSPITGLAIQLLPLVFVRPGELRAAQWDEFSFDLADPTDGVDASTPDPQWRIPACRMKMREQHIVPLSDQAVTILRQLHAHTGPNGYLFPSVRSKSRPMSENTLNAALRRLGYSKHEMTGHGFRHMASTLLHERGYRTEWIERQLAHADRDRVRARYNFAEYLSERRTMMQEWANYLDRLQGGAEVRILRAVGSR